MIDRLVRLCESAKTMPREELFDAFVKLAGEYSDQLSSSEENDGVYREMALQFRQMKDELEGVKRDLANKNKLIEKLNDQLHMSNNDRFGRSSEKMEDALAKAVDGNREAQDPIAEGAAEDEGVDKGKTPNPGKVTRVTDILNPDGRKKTGGRGKRSSGKRHRDLEGLPVVKNFEYDADELERLYGLDWYIKGWSVTRSYEVIKVPVFIKETYRPILSVGTDHMMVRVPNGNPLLKGSLVSASMESKIMYDLAVMGQPFYRQSQDLARDGVSVSRQDMSYWTISLSQTHLYPVYQLLCEQIRMQSHNQVDETYWTVIQDGRRAGSVSYIWTHTTSELLPVPPVVVYCFELTRGTDHLRNFYGKEFKGSITSDGYVAYPVYESETDGQVEVSGCFAHCRRYFWYALLVLDVTGYSPEQIQSLPEVKTLFMISEIYEAETPLKSVPAGERSEARNTTVRKKVDAFMEYIDSLDVEDPSYSAKLVEAITYTRNQRGRLVKFLEDPYIPLDNLNVERRIRPISTIRRNSLFSYSTNGAEAFTVILSLTETAKANGAHPYYYLKYLLEIMPGLIDKPWSGIEAGRLFPWSDDYRAYEESQIREALQICLRGGAEKPPMTSEIKAELRAKRSSA